MKRVTFCLACGAETPAGSACRECGAPLGKSEAGKVPGLHRRPALLYWALCALALAALVAALLVGLR